MLPVLSWLVIDHRTRNVALDLAVGNRRGDDARAAYLTAGRSLLVVDTGKEFDAEKVVLSIQSDGKRRDEQQQEAQTPHSRHRNALVHIPVSGASAPAHREPMALQQISRARES